MDNREIHVVTGAFGYTGRYLTRRLLSAGVEVRTLTGHPDRPNPFGAQVRASPFDFAHPERLVRTLEGARVLYNTYWVRFDHGDATYQNAVANTRTLFDCARRAGVERVVHVSITNPSPDSPLPYFRGKAQLEEALATSGLSYAVLRPTVLFGKEDILVNNIACLLRRLPVFGVPGRGDYRVQPVYVDDLAALMADVGRSREDVTMDAVGPETYAYRDMVRLVRDTIGARCWVARMPAWVVLAAGWLLGRLVGDVVLTRDEIDGLSADLLVSHEAPTCTTSFRAWVEEHRDTLGARYANELSRHYRRDR